MPIKSASYNYKKHVDFLHITILLTATLLIGIYLIATTVVIAKDGVTFIEYAKNLEISQIKIMKQSYQHPGYPAMILAAHKITGLIIANDTHSGWILSAQIVALLGRLLAILVLYYFGKFITNAKTAFHAVFILIMLPILAEYGSDTMSDWPNMLFLSTGMFLLVYATEQRNWLMFGLAGLTGGLGYLIRPEASQIVIFGFAWLVFQLFQKQRSLSRPKIIAAIILLLAGFSVVAGPYMKLKGALFPKKGIGEFSLQIQSECGKPSQKNTETQFTAGILNTNLPKGLFKLIQNLGQTLMWFFLVPLLVGAYLDFRPPYILKRGRFFIIALVIFNIPLMLWLYNRYSYMSTRHSMPLVVFSVFYIPAGIKKISLWLTPKLQPPKSISAWHPAVLTAIGITICIVRIIMPVHNEKIIYRKAAQWLTENTRKDSIIAVPDIRISFYAQRRGIYYNNGKIPEGAEYMVSPPGKEKEQPALKNIEQFQKVLAIDNADSKTKLIIYKRTAG